MNSQSALQQQYPLSPRKFWKKIIEKLAALYILGIMAAIIDFIVIFTTNDSYNSGTSAILWGALIIGFIFLATITILYSWYVKVYIKRYYYDGEEHFITIKKGVFAPTEIHVQWQKIQDVYVDQDILDRIMGLYDVHIASATASSGIEAHIDGVERVAAEGLKQFLLNKVSGAGKNNFQVNNSTQPHNQAQPSQPQTAPINLSEEISSNTYPLSGKWTAVTLFSRLIGSFVFPAFIVFIFFGRSDDIFTADHWVYIVLGWLALSILTMIVRTIMLFLWKNNYAFDFTPEHIYYKEGVISLSEKHMPYSSIQDVTVKQGVIERLFGLAKVVIENAAQQPMMVGRHGQQVVGFAGVMLQGLSLADANKITNVLKTTVLGRNSSRHGL
jgi:membrane protein YdbS with pleckstrin-like domain